MQKIELWKNPPGTYDEIPCIEYYSPENKICDGAIIIFPGGAYSHRAEHEGEGYAEFFSKLGISSFVVNYRVAPHKFPCPLLDARRAVRYVRANAESFGINPEKIAVIGSSAGGHLTSLLSGYDKIIEGENSDNIDEYSYKPDYQIFAYPVLAFSDMKVSHMESIINFLGEEHLSEICEFDMTEKAISPPPTFMWFTSDDPVNVKNCLKYSDRLKDLEIPFEAHIFYSGRHGLGLSEENPHVAQWSELLINWLKEVKFL